MNTPHSTEPRLLSQLNERAVLRVLQTNGPSSRAEVTRLAGVTRPTVSKAVSSLLESGLLEEFDAPENMRGRPAKKLRLGGSTSQVVGLVIDSPVCRLVTAGLDGSLRTDTFREFETPRTYDELIDMIIAQVESLRSKQCLRTLGIGVSLPGLYDYREGCSILSPNVPQTNGRCLGRDLATRLDLEVAVLQESDALCLAERHFGLAGTMTDFAMLDASTGIGLGILNDGRLLKGSCGLAGEIGHLPMVPDGIPCGCGRVGCLETLASDTAVARLVSQKQGRKLTLSQIVELVRAGDLNVSEELEQVAQQFVFALVTTINLFNPQTLFVHSRMFDLDESLLERLIRQTEARALVPSFRQCRIERARGSKREGAVAGIIEHLTDSRVSAAAPSAL